MTKKTILFFILSLLLFVDSIFAVNGIGLRPLRTNLNLNPGASSSFYLTLINDEDFTQIVKPEFQTYTSHDADGYPVAENMNKDNPKNISSWISFEENKIALKAKSEKKVKITITVPENAEPGGRYGALIYGPILTNNTGVSFRTRVASLLLLNVAGDEKFDGKVNHFEIPTGKMYSDKGIEFNVNFENTGNIHMSPKGKISIYTGDGKKINSIFLIKDRNGKDLLLNDIPVNEFENYTLPGLNRTYKANWKLNIKEGDYVAKLDFIYKKDKIEKTEQQKVDFEIIDSVKVVDFDLREEGKKTYLFLKLKNDGTVYEKLKGGIDVLNELDYKIGEIKIPNDIGYLAPNQEKEFKIKFLDKEMPKGNYIMKSNVVYGYTNKRLDLKKSFNFSNSWFIYAGIIALLVLIFLWIWKRKKESGEFEK